MTYNKWRGPVNPKILVLYWKLKVMLFSVGVVSILIRIDIDEYSFISNSKTGVNVMHSIARSCNLCVCVCECTIILDMIMLALSLPVNSITARQSVSLPSRNDITYEGQLEVINATGKYQNAQVSNARNKQLLRQFLYVHPQTKSILTKKWWVLIYTYYSR